MSNQETNLSQSEATQSVGSSSGNAQSVAFSSFQIFSALLLGAIVLFAVGFLPMEAAHNAAHDVRHALAFPCH